MGFGYLSFSCLLSINYSTDRCPSFRVENRQRSIVK